MNVSWASLATPIYQPVVWVSNQLLNAITELSLNIIYFSNMMTNVFDPTLVVSTLTAITLWVLINANAVLDTLEMQPLFVPVFIDIMFNLTII